MGHKALNPLGFLFFICLIIDNRHSRTRTHTHASQTVVAAAVQIQTVSLAYWNGDKEKAII